MDNKILNDLELDALLAHASEPRVPEGINDRLLTRLVSKTSTASRAPSQTDSNVIPFPVRRQSSKVMPWLKIAPLAVSMAAALAGGLYVGASDNLPTFLPDASSVASVDDSDQTGFEELDTILQDSQS